MVINDPVANTTFSTSWPINIPNTVGGPTAYVGFTGGTGGETSSQKIGSWTFVFNQRAGDDGSVVQSSCRHIPWDTDRDDHRSHVRFFDLLYVGWNPASYNGRRFDGSLHRTDNRDRHRDNQSHRDCAWIHNQHGEQRSLHH